MRGFGKDFYRKGNSVKRSGPFSEPPDSENWKVAVHPLPKNQLLSAAEKRGLWEGVVQEPLRRALFCVFLCSERIFSCKSHINFFQKLPLQCRHFLENPLAKNPKTQLLILELLRGFGVLEGGSERVSERTRGVLWEDPCIGELVTECTSQRSRAAP